MREKPFSLPTTRTRKQSSKLVSCRKVAYNEKDNLLCSSRLSTQRKLLRFRETGSAAEPRNRERDRFYRVYMHLMHRTDAVYVIGMLLCFGAIQKEC